MRWISPGLDCVGASRATAERNRASRDELAQRHRPVRRPRHGRRPPAAGAWPRRRVSDAMARCPPRARALSSSAASCPSSRFRARLAVGPWRTLSLLGACGPIRSCTRGCSPVAEYSASATLLIVVGNTIVNIESTKSKY
jgi:hypothetical protein